MTMDDRIVRKTQDTLGKIIKKPPLTEKLLKKPPFRFLHDIMTSVIKTTGFMKGLFTEQEMQSDNVKDKDGKIAFLQKSIDIVVLATGQSLSVRPSKVVAGHEPEKTNEFLQALAAAVSKKSKNDELVQQVLKVGGNEKPSAKASREESSDGRKQEGESVVKDRSRDREIDGSKDRDKENRHDARSSKRRDSRDDKSRGSEDTAERDSRPPKENGRTAPPTGTVPKQATTNTDEDDEDGPAARIPRPSSAKGSRRRQHREGRRRRPEDEDEDEHYKTESRDEPSASTTHHEQEASSTHSAQVRQSARPSSARPAPPKPRKPIEQYPEPEIRIGSGKPVTRLIVDDAHNSDDDDNFVVEERAPPIETQPVIEPGPIVETEGEHGGLVKKILETKKELEGGSQQPHARKVEIEKPAMSDIARRKERELVQREIDKLRNSIQTLTRSANPLGKIMDYVQEDLDSMQKELEKWTQENKEHAQALKREQSVTESSIEPLKGQLADLDQGIADQLILIAACKANILRNDRKIEKMLSSVTKS